MARPAHHLRLWSIPRWLFLVLLFLITLLLLPRGLYDAYAAGGGSGSVSQQTRSASFSISGTVADPLWLGESAPVDLDFTNPHGFTVTASHVTVAIRGVDAPNADFSHPCTAADFTVHQASDDVNVSIPPQEHASLLSIGLAQDRWPSVELLDLPTNQDGCQGASVVLDYTAEGNPR